MNTVTQDLLVELFSYEGEITLMKDGDEGLFHAIVPYRPEGDRQMELTRPTIQSALADACSFLRITFSDQA